MAIMVPSRVECFPVQGYSEKIWVISFWVGLGLCGKGTLRNLLKEISLGLSCFFMFRKFSIEDGHSFNLWKTIVRMMVPIWRFHFVQL